MAPPKGHKPYPGCETGGRPKIYTREFVDNEADALQEWMKDNQNIFVEDFCFIRGYHDERISEFNKISDKFSEVYKNLKMKQRVALFKGGLNRKFAHPMCALLLGDKHGIYAKTQQEVTTDNKTQVKTTLDLINGNSKDLVNEKE